MNKKIEELKDIGIDLVEEYFPKGECKERGSAIVLYSMLIIEFDKYLQSEREKWNKEMREMFEKDKINFIEIKEIREQGYCEDADNAEAHNEYIDGFLDQLNNQL